MQALGTARKSDNGQFQFCKPQVANISGFEQFRAQVMTINPYPLRIEPRDDESLRSYMHRLVERNALPYFNWLVTALGMNNVVTSLNQAQLHTLSRIGTIPVEDLAMLQETNAKRRPVFLGHRVTLAMVERNVSRLCLPCMRVEPYHRHIWDFTPLTRCPEHGAPLISNCPACKSPLHWRRNELAKCPDGDDLLDPALDKSFECAEPSDLLGVRAVHEFLRKQMNGECASKMQAIGDITLLDLVAMLDVLGRVSEPAQKIPRMGTKLRYGAADYHLALNRGYAIIADWPHAFYRALDHRTGFEERRRYLTDNSLNFRRHLQIHLTHNSQRPYARAISMALWQYAERHGIALVPGAFGHTPEDFHERHITASEARDLVRVDLPKLSRIAKQEGWFGSNQMLTGKSAWLRRSDVHDWLARKQKQISPDVLEKLLRVRRPTIFAIAKRGLFGTDAAARLSSNSLWRLLEAEYLDFISRLKAIQLENEPWGSTGYVTWRSFTKRPESKNIGFADLIAGVLDGRVRVSHINEASLSAIRFNLLDVVALVIGTREGPEPTQSAMSMAPAMSLRTAVRRYKICWYRLERAIDLGLLVADRRGFGITKTLVTEHAMHVFLEKFTSTTRLAYTHNKSSGSLGRIFVKFGVKPYRLETGIHRTKPIYALEDINAVGLGRIIAAAKDR